MSSLPTFVSAKELTTRARVAGRMNSLVFIVITVTTALRFTSGSDPCSAHGSSRFQCSSNPQLARVKQFHAQAVTFDRPQGSTLACRDVSITNRKNLRRVESRFIVIRSSSSFDCLGFKLSSDYFDLGEVKQELGQMADYEIWWSLALVDGMNAVDGTWIERRIPPEMTWSRKEHFP